MAAMRSSSSAHPLVERSMRFGHPAAEFGAVDRPAPEPAVRNRARRDDAKPAAGANANCIAPRIGNHRRVQFVGGPVAIDRCARRPGDDGTDPRATARHTRRSTSGSSRLSSAARPPAALAISHCGYSRPECGTDSSTGTAARGGWMIGGGRGERSNIWKPMRAIKGQQPLSDVDPLENPERWAHREAP